MDQLRELIIKHEGLRLKPYRDTVGKLTIGVGRNLDDRGITQDEALSLLNNDLSVCVSELKNYSWFISLNKIRQEVLIELVFNIGIARVLNFKKMISALSLQNYVLASRELLDSSWAKQVGIERSNNMASRLLTGKY
jgi:lysozyme